MARRVNTRFVIMMAATLGVLGSTVGGWMLYNKLRHRNPEYLKAQGELHEKDGLAKLEANQTQDGIEALKLAVINYSAAANRMSVSHVSGADAVYAHGAELCELISKKAINQDDVVRYYQASTQLLGAALSENPRNKAVNEKMLDDQYELAKRRQYLEYYKAVEELASKLIKTQDAAKPRLYRAQARLVVLSGTAISNGTLSSTAKSQREDIQADLDKAKAFDPQSGFAVALSAELAWETAQEEAVATQKLSRNPVLDYLAKGSPDDPEAKDPKEKAAQRKANMEAYFAKLLEPLREHLKTHGADVQASMAFSNMLVTEFVVLEQDRKSGSTGQANASDSVENEAKVKEATTVLEKAFEANPTNVEVANRLCIMYRVAGHQEQAEALCKKIIAQSPETPQGYYRLARHYQAGNDLLKMIAAFKDVVGHPAIGSGLDAILNAEYQRDAVESVAWYDLELADQGTSEEKASRLKEAAEYTDKLRTSHAPQGEIDLLDGRAQLINRDFAAAVRTLRRAESGLSGRRDLTAWLWRMEMTLAEANRLQNQGGLALECLDKALQIKGDELQSALRKGDFVLPNELANLINRDNLRLVLQKAQVLVQLTRYDEARLLLERYLGAQNGDSYENEKQLPLAFVEAARSMIQQVQYARDPRKIPDVRNSADVIFRALVELSNSDYEAALKDAMIVVDKPDANMAPSQITKAYEIALECNSQLKRTDDAKKLAAAALVKFPKNTRFEAFKAQLDNGGDMSKPEVQQAVIDAISDDFDRALAYSAFYARQGKWDEDIAVLQKAMTPYANSVAGRDKLNELQERCFVTALTAASRAEGAKRDEYYKTAQALATAAEMLNYDGTDGKLYRGRLEMQRTEGENGLQYMQQAVTQRPEYSIARMALGRAYYSLAEQALEQVAANPAKLAKAENNRNSALDEFRQVIRQTPNNVEARQYAIEILASKSGRDVEYPPRTGGQRSAIMQLGRKIDASALKEAQELLAGGLQFAPFDTRLLRASERLQTNLETAIKSREDILKRDPGDRDNLQRLATLYQQRSKQAAQVGTTRARDEDINSAIKLVEGDLKQHPDTRYDAAKLAELLVQYDNRDPAVTKALKLFDPFLADKDPLVRYLVLIEKADFFRSLSLSDATINALMKNNLLSHKDISEEAEALLTEAIKIEPADEDNAERRLADMYFDLGKMADAEKLYLQILTTNKSKADMDSVQRRLVEAQLRQEKFQDAMPRLEALLKDHPKDVQARILKGYAEMVQGQLEKAKTDLDEALKTDEGNTKALYNRALVLRRMGKRDEAIQDLVQAVKRDDDPVMPRLVLADMYVASQQIEAASIEFKEVLKRHPEIAEARLAYTDFLKDMVELQVELPSDSDSDVAMAIRKLDPLNRLVEQVVEEFNRLGDGPNKPLHWVYLYAYCLSTAGRDKDAQNIYEDVFRSAFFTDPTGELEEARPALSRFGPGGPEIAGVYLGSLLNAKEYAKVVDMSAIAINGRKTEIGVNPAYAVLYFRRAAANHALNKPEEAADIDDAFACGSAADTPQKKMAAFLSVLNQALAPPAATDTRWCT